jgi:hypothetical protein
MSEPFRMAACRPPSDSPLKLFLFSCAFLELHLCVKGGIEIYSAVQLLFCWDSRCDRSKQTCKEQARDIFDTWTTLPKTGSRMHLFSHENPILHVLYSSLLQTSSQKHDAQCSMLRLLSALLPRAANLPPPAGVSS